MTSPPAAVTRGARRPPGSDSTSARPPARTTASAISTADSSAPPASSCGMICSMVGRSFGTSDSLRCRKSRGFIGWPSTQPQFLDRRDRRRRAPHRLSARGIDRRRQAGPRLAVRPQIGDDAAPRPTAVADWASEQGLRLPALRLLGAWPVGGPLRGRHRQPLAGGDARRLRPAHPGPAGPRRLQHGRLHRPSAAARPAWPKRRRKPRASRALVLIAPAWDMTELMWEQISRQRPQGHRGKGRLPAPSRLWRRPLSHHARLHRGRPQAPDRRRAVRSRPAGAHPARAAGSRRALGAHARSRGASHRRLDARIGGSRWRAPPVAPGGHRPPARGDPRGF